MSALFQKEWDRAQYLRDQGSTNHEIYQDWFDRELPCIQKLATELPMFEADFATLRRYVYVYGEEKIEVEVEAYREDGSVRMRQYGAYGQPEHMPGLFIVVYPHQLVEKGSP